MPSSEPLALGELLEYTGAAVALGTFVFGAYQYWRAQTWKRSEFAAKLLDRLSSVPDLALCRDLFDEFFTYLEEVKHFLSRGLITRRDVEPLEYWLDAVANPHYSAQPVFRDFLEAYGYTGVTSLMRRFGVTQRGPREEAAPAGPRDIVECCGRQGSGVARRR